jgi:hypothetical protein
MGRIIYDIYDELMSREEREHGKRRIGRRPARSARPLADLMAVVRPEEFTNEPLPARWASCCAAAPNASSPARSPWTRAT